MCSAIITQPPTHHQIKYHTVTCKCTYIKLLTCITHTFSLSLSTHSTQAHSETVSGLYASSIYVSQLLRAPIPSIMNYSNNKLPTIINDFENPVEGRTEYLAMGKRYCEFHRFHWSGRASGSQTFIRQPLIATWRPVRVR